MTKTPNVKMGNYEIHLFKHKESVIKYAKQCIYHIFKTVSTN